MIYNPDLFFVQTFTGFKRVSENHFNKILRDSARTYVVNEDAKYYLSVKIKPSFLFYIFNKNKGHDMYEQLGSKWYSWFDKNLSKIGFDMEHNVIEKF